MTAKSGWPQGQRRLGLALEVDRPLGAGHRFMAGLVSTDRSTGLGVRCESVTYSNGRREAIL
jgi:hypothetical protein